MVDRFKVSTKTLFVFDDMATEAEQHCRQPPKENDEEVTGTNLKKLFDRQLGRCYYSGKKLTKKNVSVDHKQPLTKGGKNVISNIALCTKKVNTMKGQMTEAEFIELCRAISQH